MLTRKPFIILILGACLALLPAGPWSPTSGAKAQQDALRAAAVVNDEVISVLDLLMRVRLAILGAGMDDTPETRNRIARQILGRLIDERLQHQEAERLDIKVSDNQVDLAVEALAKQNKVTREQLFDALNQRKIFASTLRDQLRAELAWRFVIQRSLTSKVTISEDEIDEVAARVAARGGTLERRVSEISLTVETALQEDEVRQNAERLLEQLRQGGNFAGLARQFSQSATANLGGDLGWIKAEDLSEELNRVLTSMQPGQISPPIRTLTGFTILALRDQRQNTTTEVDRGRIEKSLKTQRVNQLAQRTLWQLRRNANVDIRI